MNKEPSNPKSKSTRRRDAAPYPVLARLPDVAGQPLTQPRSARAAAGFVDYRFDMPAGQEDAESRPRLRVQPSGYKRTPPSDRRSRLIAVSSRALPDSNPFAIPSTSMVDRLAPAARFLTLFLLFTAIGTFVLSNTRERSNPPKQDSAPSAAAPTGVEQKLEPTSHDDHPTIATPKAFGPLGVIDKPTDEPSKSVEIEPHRTDSPASRTERTPAITGADGEPLPQVQTTEVPTAPGELSGDAAPARLTGSIHSTDNRPDNVAKPPAVARLPSIFDAPPHAYQ